MNGFIFILLVILITVFFSSNNVLAEVCFKGQYEGVATHRRNTWSPKDSLTQSVDFPTTDNQGNLSMVVNVGVKDISGDIPLTIPQDSYQFFSTFVPASLTNLVSFTIDIVAVEDGQGTFFTKAGAPVDYIRTTTGEGMLFPVFSGSGPAGSIVIEQMVGLRIWVGRDVRDGEGGILKSAGPPDVKIDFLAVDTTGTATSKIDPINCSNCSPDDVTRVVSNTGIPFNPETGSVKFARSFAILDIPVDFLPKSGLINLQVVADYFLEPVSSEPIPCLVELSSFVTTSLGKSVLIEWRTLSEIDNVGMNLWCAQMQDNQFQEITQLNSEIIPSKTILPNYGASYFSINYPYVNTNLKSGVQHCALEDIDANGQCTLHCDQIDTTVVGKDQSVIDINLNKLNVKAIALCHQYKDNLAETEQEGICLDQLLTSH